MIVITTPSGTVGSEVVKLLTTHTPVLPFRVVTRNISKIQQQYGEQIDVVRCDFDEPDSWPAALKDIRILFLVVPKPQPKLIRERIQPFIDAAIQAGCQHIIYQSVPHADKQKMLPHYALERYIETTNVSYTMLRPSYFMQNLCGKNSTHGVDIATRHEIFIPAGRGRISFIDTYDVAEAVVKVCERPDEHLNKGYLLTGPQSLDLFAVARIFSDVLEEPVHYTNPSIPRFWSRMKQRGVPLDLLLFMIAEYTFIRFGQGGFLSDDLEKLLGRKPTAVQEFVVKNRERWLKQEWV